MGSSPQPPTGPEAIAESEARLRTLFHSLDDGFCILQLHFDAEQRPVDYRFLETNAAFERHTGLQNAEGRTARELVPDLDQSWFERYGHVALTGEATRFENHAPAMNRWFEVNAIRVGPPNLRQVALVFHDITLRKRAEEERSRALARVTEVLESMGDGFFAVDATWRLVMMNRNFEEVLQVRRDDVIGRVLWEVFPAAAEEGSRYWTEYQRCMKERVPIQFEELYAPLDLWTDVRAYPTADGGLAAFFRDISAAKRAEAALKRQAEFERQLIGIVSHDLRNPLQSIALQTSALARRDDLDPRTAKSVLRIQTSTDRAIRLVKDLLDFTQARLGGGIVVNRRPVDLQALTGQVLEEARASYPERELRLEVSGDVRGTWDDDRLTQILTNLVSNALKYSPARSPVTVSLTSDGPQVRLTVHNEGTPIPADIVERLFRPYQRAAPETLTSDRSVGLGLFIVKSIVDAHGGRTEVRSTAEEGTDFTVLLPKEDQGRPSGA